jgi:hypothetical protein
MPLGLEDVSKYPQLFERLAQIDEPKWSTEDLKKLAGLNFIRVFKEVEKVRMKQWYSTSFVRVPPDVIQLCTPLLAYNSSYAQSIIYTQNKLNKLHPK